MDVNRDSQRGAEGLPALEKKLPLTVALGVQILAALVITFGDIGFDKPGRFGLDIEDLFFLLLLWFGATCAGLWLAWGLRRAWLGKLQYFVFTLTVLGALGVVWWQSSGDAVPPAIIEEASKDQ